MSTRTEEATEARIAVRVMWRLLPYLFLCYTMNYIDRVNVGFAALEMNAALGFTPRIFGWGAGMFFLGYVFFEVPSNLIMDRVGARLWIARIMVTWGVITSCTAFVHTTTGFFLVRFLLGVAEAGFFPGIIWYLTFWIPEHRRARGAALFLTSTALSGVIGGPLAGIILKLGGAYGLAGWQWLFLLEGIPAVILGIVTFFFLDDRVEDARWLSAKDRVWLARRIAREHAAKHARHGFTLRRALTDGRVWHLCLLYFSIIISFYGVAFWLPQITKSFSGLSNSLVAASAAGPFLCAAIAMVINGRHSDATGERRWHVAGPCLVGSAGLAASAFLQDQPWGAYAALCVAAGGIWSTLGPFWSLPSVFLTGTAAAGGIALINSIGNAGGFVGPYAVGFMKDLTAHYAGGLFFLSATLLAASGLALTVRTTR